MCYFERNFESKQLEILYRLYVYLTSFLITRYREKNVDKFFTHGKQVKKKYTENLWAKNSVLLAQK